MPSILQQAWIRTALAIVLIAAGSYLLFLYLQPDRLPEEVLYGNGHVEGTEIRISAEVSGRVIEAPIEEGAHVAAGALLAKINPEELELHVAQAKAEMLAVREEHRRIREQLQTWEHHVHTAESDLQRHRELRERGNISEQQLEQAENEFREAQGQVNALGAQLEAVAARLDASAKALELAQTQLSKSVITAPLSATVLTKAIEPGEFVAPGQSIAVLMNMSDMELKVFVPEKDIGKIKLGDPARVRVDAFPARTYEASVARVDQQAQFTPREIHMPEERVRMVFGVTLDVANPDGALKAGMPADAWILWRDNSGWPEELIVPR